MIYELELQAQLVITNAMNRQDQLWRENAHIKALSMGIETSPTIIKWQR